MTCRSILLLVAACAAGCSDTGQQPTSVSLFVAGSETIGDVVAIGDVSITVERADLAFGPLYLCGGTSAGDLCDTARLEWLDTVVVNALDGTPTPAGELSGFTGPVRSWMYDLGISSQLTRSAPFVLNAAHSLGDASLVLEGYAIVNDIELPFAVAVPIEQTDATELGIPVVRKSTSDAFFQEVNGDESSLLVQFDATTWVQNMDLRPYVTNDNCLEEGPALTCDGTLEKACDGATELSNRDCAESGEVCIPGRGCAAQLTIERDSEAYRGVRNSLVSGARPFFEWNALR